jgi:hypothetical protein
MLVEVASQHLPAFSKNEVREHDNQKKEKLEDKTEHIQMVAQVFIELKRS